MTSDSGRDTGSIAVPDDSYFDVDLIEVDDLIDSATRLLNEVYNNRPMPAPITSALSPREDAMQQVQRFLSSIREESPQDDDVVFVEARPGNALPSNVRTTAVVDLCTPVGDSDDDPPTPAIRRRGLRSTGLTPQSLFQDEANCSNIPVKSRRRQPKKEPGNTAQPIVQSVTPTETVNSPPGGGTSPRLICAVCMECVINHQPSSTACGHIFCQKCILQAIRMTHKCPLCNSKLKRTQVHRVYF